MSGQSMRRSSSDISQNRLVYEALEPLGGSSARIRFSGRLLGREVIWQARLRTLEDVWRERQAGDATPGSVALRQYIHIRETADPGLAELEVALAVPAIDAPTVFKTLIMINNYKRLAPGRHEYGEPHPFPPPEAVG